MTRKKGIPKMTTPFRSVASWKALEAHHRKIRELHLRKLFTDDPKRGERFATEAAGLYLDYSKNRITDETLKFLLQLPEECGLRARIDAMFRGEKINITENRAVLHVALRAPKGASIVVDGKNVVPQVHVVLDKMADFSNRVRNGTWTGHTGKRIRNVINIGIGGIQPFDHRGSFQTKMFGWKGKLTREQTAEIAAAKQVIYDGFKAAVNVVSQKRKPAVPAEKAQLD
jgi:hypothetical protein